MLIWIKLLLPLLLVWRIGFSDDPQARRVGGFFVFALSLLLQPLLARFVWPQGHAPGGAWGLLTLVQDNLVALYLLYWGIRSGDSIVTRLASVLLALAALLPTIMLFGNALLIAAGRAHH